VDKASLRLERMPSNPNSDQILLVNGSLPPELKRQGWVEMQESQ